VLHYIEAVFNVKGWVYLYVKSAPTKPLLREMWSLDRFFVFKKKTKSHCRVQAPAKPKNSHCQGVKHRSMIRNLNWGLPLCAPLHDLTCSVLHILPEGHTLNSRALWNKGYSATKQLRFLQLNYKTVVVPLVQDKHQRFTLRNPGFFLYCPRGGGWDSWPREWGTIADPKDEEQWVRYESEAAGEWHE